MNRSAYCIQMLQLLKSRGFLTRDQIAEHLQCNKRNVLEFRKELEVAGYRIESTRGKFGGYRLLSECLLPATSLRKEESVALTQLLSYLTTHRDFLMIHEANRALEKLLSTTHIQEDHVETYIEHENYSMTSTMRSMIDKMQTAIQEHRVVEIKYRAIKDKEASWIHIHPYEILNYKGAYYCLAYSLKAKDFRNFKFSEERLKDLCIKDAQFLRDRSFDIKKHIGKSGLIKGELYSIEVLIYDESARAIAERKIGIQPSMTWVDERTLLLKTMFEGTLEAIKFLLSLGKHAKLIAPKDLRELLFQEVKAMYEIYDNN